uniref:Uncharacterized protein n=1 Tax=Anguilla anguilla TaxID=7936 RepID=A0A0E9UD30_ANGAN
MASYSPGAVCVLESTCTTEPPVTQVYINHPALCPAHVDL